jgi:hypothetical protein
MFHTIEFTHALTAAVATHPSRPLERVSIKAGTRVQAQVRSYVAESRRGPVEVADLFFDGGTALRVPCESFRFVD